MNEKQRERPENINHGATYGNRRLSILSHSVIKVGEKEPGKKGDCKGNIKCEERKLQLR